MNEVVIHLPGVPQGKGRPRFVRATGHAFTPAKTRSYESLLQGAAIQAMDGRAPLAGPLAVEVLAYFPIPQSWSRRKRADAAEDRVRPVKRPDADNLLKTLDAMNGVVFVDDAQIVSATVMKFYAGQPSLVVKVRGA